MEYYYYLAHLSNHLLLCLVLSVNLGTFHGFNCHSEPANLPLNLSFDSLLEPFPPNASVCPYLLTLLFMDPF